MVNLPHTTSPPSVAHEGLRERYCLGHLIAEMPIKIVDLDRVRPQSGHHAGTCRIAERQLIVRPIKPHARCRQPINVRCFGDQVSIAPQRRREVVDGNKQDIRFGCPAGDGEEQESNKVTHEVKTPETQSSILCALCASGEI